ncbi:MAG: V4R domain-containing protein [Candidatus Bathyarchaeia archaeon]
MNPEPKVSRDPENGRVFLNGDRVFSFRIKTFQAYMDRLGVAGDKVSQVLMDQMGIAAGHVAMDFVRDRIHSIEDLGKVTDETLSELGAGRCLGIEQHSEGSTNKVTVRLRGTPLTYNRKATEPACHAMRGLMQGWIEGYLDRKAVSSIETACESMGASECVFGVTFIQ